MPFKGRGLIKWDKGGACLCAGRVWPVSDVLGLLDQNRRNRRALACRLHAAPIARCHCNVSHCNLEWLRVAAPMIEVQSDKRHT